MLRKLLLTALAGTLVMALSAWLMSSEARPTLKPDAKYRFMHCRNCGKEKLYDPDKLNECFRCGEGHPMFPTEESIAKTGLPPSPYGRMIAPLILEFNILLALLWYLSRPARRGGSEEDTEYLYTRCVKCRRKLRY